MVREAKVLVVIIFALVIVAGAANKVHAVLEAQDGCLVPYAFYNATTDTAIGLMSWSNSNSIYWSFMSPEGVQISHGVIPLNGAYSHPFSLKTEDGNANENVVGYVIFTYDNDGTLQPSENRDQISANAVLLTTGDAAYIPVIPLDRSDYANGNVNLNALSSASIVGLSYGYAADKTVSVHYWIDPALAAQTQIIIWTSETPPANFAATIYSVTGVSSGGVSFNRDHMVLNAYDLATEAQNLPAGYVDGLLDISVGGGERFVFSLIQSSAFSAMQTMIGFSRP